MIWIGQRIKRFVYLTDYEVENGNCKRKGQLVDFMNFYLGSS